MKKTILFLCFLIIITIVISLIIVLLANKSKISKETAYEGVNNYCHSKYDWSIADENPEMMYVKMGEETETEYQVIFRSYTGSFVYFYVDKNSGTTRLIDYVPNLDIKNEAGTININDYI